MQTFEQNQKPTQKSKTSGFVRPSRELSGQSREVSSILRLQRTIGNQAVQQLLRHKTESLDASLDNNTATRFSHDFSRIPVHDSGHSYIQPKLKVNTPGDIYEQEADRVSKQIMAMPGAEHPKPIQCQSQNEDEIIQDSLLSSITPMVQRQETQGEGEKEGMEDDEIVTVQPKLLQWVTRNGRELESRLNNNSGSGSPMAADMRAFFEPRLQSEFSKVRVHTDSEAVRMNHELGARAFTHGRDIYFGSGQYVPNSVEGKKLFAHELTHEVQQRGVQSSPVNSINKSVKSNFVQRQVVPALGAAEWIALGAAGYLVAQDAVTAAAGDISYTFDEMEGVLLPGGGSDVAQYRNQHPNANIRSYTHKVATWLTDQSGVRAMGIKFGITFNYDGHAIGNISCSILDTYDVLGWEGKVNVNFTPQSLDSGGVSTIRITLNLGADRSLLGGMARSRILRLDGTGIITITGSRGAHVRFG